MPSLSTTEQLKLIANGLNSLAVSIVTVGVFSPAAFVIYGIGEAPRNLEFVASIVAVCVCFGAALHLTGLWILAALDGIDDD